MLSEEEKKAIERLNEILKEYEEIVNIEDKTEREIEMSLYMEDMPFAEIKTVLNLITKLQKENNLLNNYVKENEIYKKNLFNYAEKKDKQIDLMAKMIDELSEYYTRYNGKNNEFCKEICIKKDIDCIDCIKQYFETKAKKGE